MFMNFYRSIILSLVASTLTLSLLCSRIHAVVEAARRVEKKMPGFRMMLHRQGRVGRG